MMVKTPSKTKEEMANETADAIILWIEGVKSVEEIRKRIVIFLDSYARQQNTSLQKRFDKEYSRGYKSGLEQGLFDGKMDNVKKNIQR